MMKKSLLESLKMEAKLLGFIIFLTGATLYAQEPIPLSQKVMMPFDVNIVENVSHYPEKSEEFLIGTNIYYIAATNNQYSPSVAFDGLNFLVVWEDKRSGSSYDIYCTRVNQAGEILDPSGIAISTATDDQEHPSVAFDGINYLVVWHDYRNGSWDIYGARVSQSGGILDPSGIPISTAASSQGYSSVAFGDTNYLVLWYDARNYSSTDWDIYGARVDTSGTVLEPSGIAISTADSAQEFPSVAFDDTNYVVVWQDNRNGNWDIYGARVSQSGVVLDSSGLAVSTTSYSEIHPSVAFNGENWCLVAWEHRWHTLAFIRGKFITRWGDVFPWHIAISGNSNIDHKDPCVAFNGTDYLIAYTGGLVVPHCYTIRCGCFTKYGTFIHYDIQISHLSFCDQYNPSLAFDGSNYLVVWEDDRGTQYYDIYGTRVDGLGGASDASDFIVSNQTSHQDDPSVAFDGTNYLVVWEEQTTSYNDIYAARVSQSKDLLDSSGIAISTASSSQEDPSVAFDGTNYLVVWDDYRNSSWDIYGARVSQSGVVLDPSGIAISIADSNQVFPSVAFDGINYLVVWHDARNYSSTDWDIYGTRVDQSGTVLDPSGISISTADFAQRYPSVAFDDTNYLVVWHDARNYSSTDWDIYGTRVNQSGTVLDPSGISISTADSTQSYPSVAFDGTNHLVVWEDKRNSLYDDIYGARVNQSGDVLDPSGIVITSATYGQENPSIAFDDTNYLVVWEDERNYSSTNRRDIFGAKLDTSGYVIDSFAVSLQPREQDDPDLAHGVGNQFLIVYSGWTEQIGGNPCDTMRIWGKFYPFTGSDEPNISVTPDTLEFSYSKGRVAGLSLLRPEIDSPEFSSHNLNCDSDLYVLPEGEKIVSQAHKSQAQEPITLSSMGARQIDTLYYDDGVPMYYLTSENYLCAVRFTPASACSIVGALTAVYNPNSITTPCTLWVWDDNGGVPGNVIGGPIVFGTPDRTWQYTPLSVEVTRSDFHIGYWVPGGDSVNHYPSRGPNALIDNGGGDRSNWNEGGGWASLSGLGDLFIRAIVSYAAAQDTVETMVVHNYGYVNLNVTDITGNQPWITNISPTTLTVAPGDSQNVTVTVTRDGLSDGTYYANLSITSNDPDTPTYLEPVKFVVGGGTGITYETSLPKTFFLAHNYPNPFSRATKIKYGVPKDCNVNITVYNLCGQRVITLTNKMKKAGCYETIWNGVNDKGMKIPSGIYFYRLETKFCCYTRKLLMIR